MASSLAASGLSGNLFLPSHVNGPSDTTRLADPGAPPDNRVMRRGVMIAVLLILSIDAFATALYFGARVLVEDGLRSSLVKVVTVVSRIYQTSGRNDLKVSLKTGEFAEIFILDPENKVIYSTDTTIELGHERLVLATDRTEIDAARVGKATAGFPFRSENGYLLRAYAPIAPRNHVIGLSASAPSFEDLDRLEKVYWTWIALSAALGILIAVLYGRAVRQIESERIRAERGERYEAISRMAASVAHEIRNPLNIISATLELRLRAIGEAPTTRDESEMLKDLSEEVDRLERVVQDFLDLSREQELQPSTVEVNEVVELVVYREERRIQARSRQATEIRVVLDRGAGSISADRDRIIQMLGNLLRNATEAAGTGGRVEVRTHARAHEVLITVEDSGPGIPEADRDRIFDPWLTTKRHGSGLGLAVVRTILEAHGGTISVDTGSLGGARFRVRLPRKAREGSIRAGRRPAPPRRVGVQAPALCPQVLLSPRGPGYSRRVDELQILIIDDEAKMARLMASAIAASGRTIETETNSAAALKRVKRERFDVVITDLRMPEVSGLEILEAAMTHTPPPVVILCTAFATAETAVEAMKKGAFDYLIKPVKIDELAVVVEKAALHISLRNENRELKDENRDLRQALDKKYRPGESIIGSSPAMQDVMRVVERVARTRSTVLIRGESGTGKELIARAIHFQSPRMNAPFVKVNCAAIPSGLLESEFFGHMRGSFTGAIANHIGKFERADTGSIFLDEVGEIPIDLQTKLLRVLQESEFERVGGTKTISVDVRIIAATNRDLEAAIRAGKFREDLYYRLNVVEIHVPQLSERQGDVELLIDHFLKLFNEEMGANRAFDELTRKALLTYPWPGNIRELENCIEHAVVISEGDTIRIEDLPQSIRKFVENGTKA
jgi:two-component system, NtrC family, response regulator AtoC